MSYRELAFAVLSRFIDDIEREDLRRIVDKTYTRATFGSDAITPLSTLEPGLHVLHLSNGPTLAFKDIALQFLGNLFEHVLAREHRGINILGATSGDTGSSAEYALRGKRGITVFMLSPHGRMSPFQVAQMFSLTDANIHNLAIEGHVRRLPGSREGGQRRRSVQVEARDRRGQLDQLGARRSAGRVLLLRLLPGNAGQRRRSRLRSPIGATSATSSPATSRASSACPFAS
jgi:hypothetical protein